MNTCLSNIPELSSSFSTCLCSILSCIFLIWIGFMSCKLTSKTTTY